MSKWESFEVYLGKIKEKNSNYLYSTEGACELLNNYKKRVEVLIKENSKTKKEYRTFINNHEKFYQYIQSVSDNPQYLGMQYGDIAVDMIKKLKQENNEIRVENATMINNAITCDDKFKTSPAFFVMEEQIKNLKEKVAILTDGILDARRTLDVKTYDALDWKIHDHLEGALKKAELLTGARNE